MTSFLKKKFQFVAALVLGLVLPGLLCPFYYFLPENSLNQPKKVNAYEHQPHFHSEIQEAYVHLIAHPSDPEQDKKFHQAHSSRDHVNDYVDFCNVQRNVRPIKSILVIKHVDFPVCFEASKPLISYRVKFEIPTFKLLKISRIHPSRSPPYISI